MAEQVRVTITDAAIISALNTPGGGVYEWRNDVRDELLRDAREISPVNEVMNALHRDGVVGEFKASWRSSITGSNQHRLRLKVYNVSDHAKYVEFGRRGSTKVQTFSWTEWKGIGTVGGEHGGGTRSRRGQHVLRNATNRTMKGIAPPLS